MRKFNKSDIAVIVKVTIFAILFVAFFFWFETLHFPGPGPDAAMASGLTLIFFYSLLFVLSVLLSVMNLIFWKKIAERWIRWLGILPICLTVGTPIICFIADGIVDTFNDRPHLLVYELKSSQRLEHGRRDLIKATSSSGGILIKPSEEDGTFHYEFSDVINTQRQEGRRLEIEADGCVATFHFDIPYRPEPMPLTEWKSPTSIKCDPPGSITLQIRYSVEPYDRRY